LGGGVGVGIVVVVVVVVGRLDGRGRIEVNFDLILNLERWVRAV
jgi:hypothetical protein